MDAMLVRQYNLIQCFSSPKATGNDLANDDSTIGGWPLTVLGWIRASHL